MARRIIPIIVAGILAPFSVTAHSSLIDFDSLTAGNTVENQFSELGVTFVDTVVIDISLTGSSEPNAINHLTQGFQIDPSDPMEATFDSWISSVSVRALDVGTDGAMLQAFDAVTGGTLIDSSQAIGTAVGIDQFFDLTVSGSGIRRVTMSHVSNDSGEGIAFDNFSFSSPNVTVPTPSTFWLFGAGIVALGFAWKMVGISTASGTRSHHRVDAINPRNWPA